MSRRPDHRRLTFAAVILVAAMLIGAASASAERSGPVTAWARRNTIPLATVDPAAPLDDLERVGIIDRRRTDRRPG